jgi:hypothetical protein
MTLPQQSMPSAFRWHAAILITQLRGYHSTRQFREHFGFLHHQNTEWLAFPRATVSMSTRQDSIPVSETIRENWCIRHQISNEESTIMYA